MAYESARGWQGHFVGDSFEQADGRAAMPAARRAGGIAAMLCVIALALYWPGISMYDSTMQYAQVLSGVYDDWHPPAMARLWAVFGAHGAAPMFVLQMALYWIGLGLIAAALALDGRRRAAWLTIAIGLWPQLLGWQAAVLKDGQMLGAMLAATGIVAWSRLRGRTVPAASWGAVSVLLAYAVLVRANAVFAVMPLLAMLVARRWAARGLIVVAGTAAVLMVSPVINHRLLGAVPSGVERTQAMFDLAGIAVRTGDSGATDLSPAAIAVLRAKRCVRPFFWDPLGDDSRCAAEMAGLHRMPPGALYVRLATAVVRHPLAYAAQRLAHLNSTERWLVPRAWPNAAPPLGGEPNTMGLVQPGRAASYWPRIGGWLVETPVAWPVVWVVLAIGGVVVAARARDAAGRLALALLVSALALEASFAVLSIASDLRYHLWSMAATALGLALLGARCRRIPAAILVAAGLVAVTGVAARLSLPVPAPTYQGMLG